MAEIILVRHGKTAGNLEGRYIGSRTDEPLCEEGIHALEEKVREGGAADLVLFDDQTPYTVEKFHSKASNSPFVGVKLYGKVHYTICSGETVYRAE